MSSEYYFDIKLVFEPRDSRIVKLNKVIALENFLFLTLILFSGRELF